MSRLRIVAFVIGFLVVIGLILGVIAYLTSFQYLTVTFNNPTKSAAVELYNTEYNEGSDQNIITSKVQVIKSGERLKLQKGVYAIQTKGEGYAPHTVYVGLGDTEIKQTYEFEFTTDYLTSLLKEQESNIREVLYRAYPQAATLYRATDGKILMQGDWYVTFLNYIGPDDSVRDTLKVVLHKEDSDWKLASKPQLSIGSSQYPDIPKQVLDYANATIKDPPTAAQRGQ